MKSFKKALSVLLCALMLVPFALMITSAAVFESKPVASVTTDNTNDKNTNRCAYTRESYIYQDGDNIVIIRATDAVYVASYNKNYQKISEKTINFELPIFGGFYSGEAFNYMVFGQMNTEESTTKEVYRIVKYDKNFNKISHASIIGSQCNTITPFRSSSVSMAESGNELTVHTSRLRFTSDDGLNHQSQFTVVLDTRTMTPTNNLKLFQDNHVSHSFNQFVQYDNGARVLVDHGDAYPRSVVLSKYLGKSQFGYENYNEVSLFTIPGPTGANCTGVYVGGFEVSENNYIVSINTIDHSKATGYNSFSIEGLEVDIRDAVLLISAKNNTSASAVKQVYLTDYANSYLHASAPYLVKLTEKWFAVLWTEYKAVKKQSGNSTYYNYVENGIKYVIVDENGNKLSDIETVSATARLSDCQPILADKKIIWHYDDGSKRNICSLDISSELEAIAHTHTLETIASKASTCTIQGNNKYYKCTICGKCFKDSSATTATTANAEMLPLASHKGGTATCTKKANCSVCGTPYGPTLPHLSGDWVVSDQANCTHAGTKIKKCLLCGKTLETGSIPQENHVPGEWVVSKQPDCTNPGTKVKKCTVCGLTVETGSVPSKGHVPGEWVVTEEPTISSFGKKVKYCTVCFEKISEQTIPMIGTLTAKDNATGIEFIYPENAFNGLVGISAVPCSSSELEAIINNNIGDSKYKAYNISITVDGGQVTPNSTRTLRIPAHIGLNADYTDVYLLNPNNGNLKKISAKLENGYYVIENATGGCYVIAEKETTLTLSSNTLTLRPGKTVQLNAYSNRGNISFTSSDPYVADVDQYGYITTYSSGTAIITVYVDGTNVKETCTVTVKQGFFERIFIAILEAITEFFEMLNNVL